MKKKFTTVPPISTKQTITPHLNSLLHEKKRTMTYDAGNPRPGLGQVQKCGEVKPVYRIQTPLLIAFIMNLV
jgi:hypothetical protein